MGAGRLHPTAVAQQVLITLASSYRGDVAVTSCWGGRLHPTVVARQVLMTLAVQACHLLRTKADQKRTRKELLDEKEATALGSSQVVAM